MRPLTLEIHGTGTHNRGAELMAIAVADRMRKTFPGVRIVVPIHFGDVEARARHGFLTTWELPGRIRVRLTRLALRFGSPAARFEFGIVDPRELDAVLDASGFSFSDQWGPGGARGLLNKMQKGPRKRIPLILLPQALGSFNIPEVASASRELFDRASLVCARDSQSHAAAMALGVPSSKLRKFPDFTVGIAPIFPLNINLPGKFTAVVPNNQMLNRGESLAATYLNFLLRCISLLKARNMNPVFVLHDADQDRRVVELVRAAGQTIPVIEHADPRVLKGILGRATLVIGSRFHALVSGFSQGIPCIGVGWSHKYPELFADFDCTELLITDLSDSVALNDRLELLFSAAGRSAYEKRIVAAAARIKTVNETMWQEIEDVLRTCRRNSDGNNQPLPPKNVQ